MSKFKKNVIVSKHKIIKHLGNGAFGDVYLAKNIISGHLQALKVVETNSKDNIHSQVQEIRNLVKCNSDYVVKLNEADIVTHEGHEYIAFALEYLEQGSLEKKVKSSDINFREILTAIRHTLHALNVAHGLGIIHKDVKPANIMVDTPNFKLGDFGLSFVKSEESESAHYNYILHSAPENMAGNVSDERSDIYAVGMTLFRLVIPAAFFELDYDRILKWMDGSMKKNLPTDLGYPKYLPIRLKKIINKATAVSPDDRYQSALEMLQDLEKLQVKIAWSQSADGSSWNGQCNGRKEHHLRLEQKGSKTYCRYKVNSRKPQQWNDVGPDYDSANNAMNKKIASSLLI